MSPAIAVERPAPPPPPPTDAVLRLTAPLADERRRFVVALAVSVIRVR